MNEHVIFSTDIQCLETIQYNSQGASINVNIMRIGKSSTNYESKQIL